MKINDEEVVIKVFVLPGGQMPTQSRKDGGADIGWDILIRAIVSPEMDAEHTYMRKTIWNFHEKPPVPHHTLARYEGGRSLYSLRNSERICLGTGFILGGNSNEWYATIVRRSRAAMKELVQMKDLVHFTEDIIIDPNFQAEPIIYFTNLNMDPIDLYHGWNFFQIRFNCECTRCQGRGFLRPRLEQVGSIEELGQTTRGNSWNGSSDQIDFFQSEFQLFPRYQGFVEAIRR